MTTAERERDMTTEVLDRDALARGAMPLVSHCVAGISSRLPRHVRHDELASAGLLGLTQAASTWDPGRGVTFEHYARRRIQGALLDELRSRDWASRSARRDGRSLRVMTEELTARLGRSPEDHEVAAKLGVTVADIVRIREDLDRSAVVHLDGLPPERADVPAPGVAADPANQVLSQEMHGYLRDAVVTLPERLRKVVVEYFFEERPMQDIAADLGVTVSRVSQLRAQALKLMREGIQAQFEGDETEPAPVSRAERRRAEYRSAIASASSTRERISSSAPGVVERLVRAG